MTVLLDSGFLVATLNSAEGEHINPLETLAHVPELIVLPVPAIAEVVYLLARDVGGQAAADFVASLASTEFLPAWFPPSHGSEPGENMKIRVDRLRSATEH